MSKNREVRMRGVRGDADDSPSLAERLVLSGRSSREELERARASMRPPRRDAINPLLRDGEGRVVRMSMAGSAIDVEDNPLLARLLACRPELRQCVPVRLSNGDLGYPDPETACVLIVEALARHGISLPPFVHAGNLKQLLLAALHALDGADDEDLDAVDDDVYGFGDEGDYTVTV